MIRAFDEPSPTTGVAWRDDRTRIRLSAIRRTEGRMCLPHRSFRDGSSIVVEHPDCSATRNGSVFIVTGRTGTSLRSYAEIDGRCVDYIPYR